MPENGLGSAIGRVVSHGRRLASLQVELAKSEVRRKAGATALGVGLGVGAAFFALIALALLVAAGVVALALVLPDWAAVLVGAGVALLVAGVLAAAAVSALRSPMPKQALEEARLTKDALRG